MFSQSGKLGANFREGDFQISITLARRPLNLRLHGPESLGNSLRPPKSGAFPSADALLRLLRRLGIRRSLLLHAHALELAA